MVHFFCVQGHLGTLHRVSEVADAYPLRHAMVIDSRFEKNHLSRLSFADCYRFYSSISQKDFLLTSWFPTSISVSSINSLPVTITILSRKVITVSDPRPGLRKKGLTCKLS